MTMPTPDRESRILALEAALAEGRITSDEVLTRIRDAATNLHGVADIDATDTRLLLRLLDSARAEAEQLRVQLAGVSVVAAGHGLHAGEPNYAQHGMYGWSVAYDDVRNLRLERDRLRALLERAHPWMVPDCHPDLARLGADIRAALTLPSPPDAADERPPVGSTWLPPPNCRDQRPFTVIRHQDGDKWEDSLGDVNDGRISDLIKDGFRRADAPAPPDAADEVACSCGHDRADHGPHGCMDGRPTESEACRCKCFRPRRTDAPATAQRRPGDADARARGFVGKREMDAAVGQYAALVAHELRGEGVPESFTMAKLSQPTPATAQRLPSVGDEVEVRDNGEWRRGRVSFVGSMLMDVRLSPTHGMTVGKNGEGITWRWPAPASEAAGGDSQSARTGRDQCLEWLLARREYRAARSLAENFSVDAFTESLAQKATQPPPSQPRMSDAFTAASEVDVLHAASELWVTRAKDFGMDEACACNVADWLDLLAERLHELAGTAKAGAK